MRYQRLLPLLTLIILAQQAVGFVLFSPWGTTEKADGTSDPYRSRTGALDWESPASFDLYETAFIWSAPSDPLDTSGLGGGITWALHPNFCDEMLPLFPEASRTGTFATFLTCCASAHHRTHTPLPCHRILFPCWFQLLP